MLSTNQEFTDYVWANPLCIVDEEWLNQHMHLWTKEAFMLPEDIKENVINDLNALVNRNSIYTLYSSLIKTDVGRVIPAQYSKSGKEIKVDTNLTLQTLMRDVNLPFQDCREDVLGILDDMLSCCM